MRPRPYTEVLGALVRLGSRIMREDVEMVSVMRGFPSFVYVPKDPELSVVQQRLILRELGYEEEEFLAAFEGLH